MERERGTERGAWRGGRGAQRVARGLDAQCKALSAVRRLAVKSGKSGGAFLPKAPAKPEKGWNMKTTKYFVVYSKNPSCFKKIFS